ncbi:hypothetical protein JVU11DRAFT_4159 [Chiua virens]|nr:hypothetical protein JVU11DRAFT_4159 [Chiua virens]
MIGDKLVSDGSSGGLSESRSSSRRCDKSIDCETRTGTRTGQQLAPASGEQSQPIPPLKAEEQEIKFPFLLKARIKSEVKPEDISFENIVRDRLALIGLETIDLDVPQPLLEATATRMFMSRTWGGRPSDMFPQASKNFTHGLDDFMYINPKYDPHVPLWPGAPGFFLKFGKHGEERWPKIMRVVVRVGIHAWQYMGQYALTAAPPLVRDEWNAQSHQNSFAREARSMAIASEPRLYCEARLGREPTFQELAAALRSKKKFEASPDDIVRECNEGNVVVRVWCMKCVGYDVDFQREIAAGS